MNANTEVPVLANVDIIKVFLYASAIFNCIIKYLKYNFISIPPYPPCTTTFEICLFIIFFPIYVNSNIQQICNTSILTISPAELI